MARQDEETLDERRRDDHQHDHGDLHQRCFIGDHEGCEGTQRRQRRGNHGRQHASRARCRGFGGRRPGVELRYGLLADHDRIVDDDAERHDEADQADAVDRASEVVEGEQRREEGRRDAHHHPEGGCQPQEQEQRADHQHEAHEPVADDERQFVLDEPPSLEEQVQRDALGQRRLLRLQVGVEILRGIERVRCHVATDEERDGRLAADREIRLVDHGPAFDLRDVTEADQAAVAGVDGKVLEGGRVPALVEAAQLARHFAVADSTPRCVRGQPRKLAAEFVEAQAQFQERPRVDLDGDLFDREAGELHGVHAAAEQFVLHLLGERNQLVQAARTGHQHCRDQFPVTEDVDVRRLDLGREAAHLGHALLHRVHGLVDVRAGLHPDLHEARRVAGDTPHGLDAGDGLELLFERRGHQPLHVLRAGTAPADGDVREPLRLHGIEADVELADGPNAREHHQHHA